MVSSTYLRLLIFLLAILFLPFICWWTSRLLPSSGYYTYFFKEHWGTCSSFQVVVFSGYMPSSGIAGWVKNLPAMQETQGDICLIPGSGRSPGEGKWQPTLVFLPEKFHGHRSLWATVQKVTNMWKTQHMVYSFLVFKGVSILFSIMPVSAYIPINSAGGSFFIHILSGIYCL